ncbi:spore germination protein, partial [Bacillus mobilis]
TKKHVSPVLRENTAFLKEALGVDKSFDVIQLNVEYAEREMALYLVDGFVKDDILHYLMKLLSSLDKEQLEGDTLAKLVKTYIPYVEVETLDDLDKVVDAVLSGPTALFA